MATETDEGRTYVYQITLRPLVYVSDLPPHHPDLKSILLENFRADVCHTLMPDDIEETDHIGFVE